MHKKYISCFVIVGTLATASPLLAHVASKDRVEFLYTKKKEKFSHIAKAVDALKKAKSLNDVHAS